MNLTYNLDRLVNSSIFKSKTDLTYYLLLSSLRERNEPTGSWVLKMDLDRMGIDSSTATIGRYLKELDAKGYTLPQGNQGRLLTQEGYAYLVKLEDSLYREQIQTETAENVRIVEYDELIDLYAVRKILEIEAVRVAAKTATQEEIAKLSYSIMMYRQFAQEQRDFTDPALDFHILLAECTHNKFMYGVLNMLIHEQKRIELQMDTLVTRETGMKQAQDHEDIVMAIVERDPDRAARLMEEHIDELILSLKEVLNSLAQNEPKE